MIDLTNKLDFNSEKALNYLATNGKIYTLRTQKNLSGLKAIFHNGQLEFNADVTYEDRVEVYQTKTTLEFFYSPNLNKYVERSGFNDAEEWLNECKKFHIDFSHMRYLYLYLVHKKILIHVDMTKP